MLSKIQELPSKAVICLSKWIQKGSILIPLTLLIVTLALYLFIRVDVITSWSVDAGGIEQNVVYSLLRRCNGYDLYLPTHQPPFSVTQYAPFYYHAIGWLHHLIAPENPSLYFYYCLNRSFGLAGNLAMAITLYYLVSRQLKIKKPYPFWISVLCFIVLPPQTYARPDSWYLAFFFFSTLFFIRYIQRGIVRELYPMAFFTILALYTKQTALGLVICQSALLLLYARSFRHIFFYCLAILTALIGLYFAFALPELDIFLQNTVTGISNGISLDNFKYNIIDHFHKPFLLVDLAGIGVSLFLIIRTEKTFAYLGYLALGMFLFATGTALKNGSALNYYIEFVILTLLGVISLKNPQLAKPGEQSIPSWVSYYLLLGVTIDLLLNAPNFNWIRAFRNDISEQLYVRDQSIADFLYRDGLKKGQQVYTPEQFSFLNLILFEYTLFPQHDILIEMNGLNYDQITNFDPSKVRYILLNKATPNLPFRVLNLEEYQEIGAIGEIRIMRLRAVGYKL
jgi:hypothetical protein